MPIPPPIGAAAPGMAAPSMRMRFASGASGTGGSVAAAQSSSARASCHQVEFLKEAAHQEACRACQCGGPPNGTPPPPQAAHLGRQRACQAPRPRGRRSCRRSRGPCCRAPAWSRARCGRSVQGRTVSGKTRSRGVQAARSIGGSAQQARSAGSYAAPYDVMVSLCTWYACTERPRAELSLRRHSGHL